jgi:hypothetical protein
MRRYAPAEPWRAVVAFSPSFALDATSPARARVPARGTLAVNSLLSGPSFRRVQGPRDERVGG